MFKQGSVGLIFIMVCSLSFSQEKVALLETIKSEVASLPHATGSAGGSQEFQEIPLKKCSGKHAYFAIGNIYDNELAISISASGAGNGETVLESIQVLFGRYGKVELPDSALYGITIAECCIKNKRKQIHAQCKVVRTKDKKRVYISIQNGNDQLGNNTVWIINEKKYFGRMVTAGSNN